MTHAADRSAILDVVVAGGGPVGLVFALAATGRGARVAVIEARPWADDAGGGADPRAIGLSPASVRILDRLGVMERIPPGEIGLFRGMHVWDAGGRGEVRFDCAELDLPWLGAIIGLDVIETALRQAARDAAGLALHVPNAIESLRSGEDHVVSRLGNGTTLGSRLVAGADGRESPVRDMAGIGVRRHAYRQQAIVANVTTERPHGQVARQRFLRSGPVAFLPLADPHACAIVWSVGLEQGDRLMRADERRFAALLGEAFGHRLGAVTQCGPRAAWPLQRVHAERYIAGRIALLGDAAHVIHPLAGQGMNLGLLDAAALADAVGDALAAGRDPGARRVLRRYERWRRGGNTAMMAAMDGFRTLFGTDLAPVRGLRNAGLAMVDRLPPVKRFFMRYATGQDGDMPSLAQAPSTREQWNYGRTVRT